MMSDCASRSESMWRSPNGHERLGLERRDWLIADRDALLQLVCPSTKLSFDLETVNIEIMTLAGFLFSSNNRFGNLLGRS